MGLTSTKLQVLTMPRLLTRDIIKAYRLHKLLPLLLKECRSIDLAQNELRWLADAVVDKNSNLRRAWPKLYQKPSRTILSLVCRARSKGMPLQYILGDQPFGDLEILCEKGVLIPRPETEAYTIFIGNLLASNRFSSGLKGAKRSPDPARPLRILDICSGTGCISLLLHAMLAPHFQQLSVLGIDISSTAIRLANLNIKHNIQRGLLSDRSRTEVSFCQGDVFNGGRWNIPGIDEVLSRTFSPGCGEELEPGENADWDVLVSNPPYISSQSYRNGPTSRSVRHFEPKIALVPPPMDSMLGIPRTYRKEDIFYYHLIALSFKLSVRLTVLECGDREQGSRVADICKVFASGLHQNYDWDISIWPDVEAGYHERFEEACAVVLHKQLKNKP